MNNKNFFAIAASLFLLTVLASAQYCSVPQTPVPHPYECVGLGCYSSTVAGGGAVLRTVATVPVIETTYDIPGVAVSLSWNGDSNDMLWSDGVYSGNCIFSTASPVHPWDTAPTMAGFDNGGVTTIFDGNAPIDAGFLAVTTSFTVTSPWNYYYWMNYPSGWVSPDGNYACPVSDGAGNINDQFGNPTAFLRPYPYHTVLDCQPISTHPPILLPPTDPRQEQCATYGDFFDEYISTCVSNTWPQTCAAEGEDFDMLNVDCVPVGSGNPYDIP